MVAQFVGKKIAGQAVRDRFAGSFTIAAAFSVLARRRAYTQIVHWNASGLGSRGRADLRPRDEPITVSIGEERGRKDAARRPQAAA
jgi:hypothetical protein